MSSSEQKNDGRVIWITGLSGAGKTTLARALLEHLPDAILLNGDELRKVLSMTDAGFDAASRKTLARIYARLAGFLAWQGVTVVVDTISLFHEVHAWNREHLPNYLEVFLDVPEEERRRRDPKGLYVGQRAGRVKDMAGADTRIELPIAPHLRLDGTQSLEDSVRLILEKILPEGLP